MKSLRYFLQPQFSWLDLIIVFAVAEFLREDWSLERLAIAVVVLTLGALISYLLERQFKVNQTAKKTAP